MAESEIPELLVVKKAPKPLIIDTSDTKVESYPDDPASPLPLHVQQACQAAKVQPVSNPFPQNFARPVYTNGDRFLICLVGLPGRGKTHISYRVAHWLVYFHDIPTKVVNLGNSRRKLAGSRSSLFFDPTNEKAQKILDTARLNSLKEIREFLLEVEDEGKNIGRIAIYDASNITIENRTQVIEEMKGVLPKSHIIFAEVVQTDQDKIDSHIRNVKIHVGMPDYKDSTDKEKVVDDYKQRITKYETEYVPLGADKSLSFIRIVDDGRQVTVNRIKGFLPGQIVNYLMNIHTQPRPLYLSRHGESQYNTLKKIGGNSPLSPMGEEYAKALASWVKENVVNPKEKQLTKNPKHARLYTSSLRRTIDTVRHFDHTIQEDGWVTMRRREWRCLDEIFAGVFDGMTYEQIKEKAPQQFELRCKNKLEYRYPRGESYLDVIKRVEQAVVSMEGLQDPVVVVAHQAVLRIVYAYFTFMDKSKAPTISIPLNTVIKLVPRNHGCDEERFVLLNKENKMDSNNAPSH
mmetsp:Transcript_14962/g.26901  ORF Transcript_14962/g.26901 Transcript_14962/m.26901 type:complete len:518 (-) Transcript_14962:78-1631(-)|eukprot:CAMPEP_0197518208 /NCGR_PEP_ID=MMETSP1318-20131121/3335_1 /TAXON_ID=552666 /ORGANISM="Partenskyella glossopodia, Strain RCC365" /LENGTH=517 /DNA_ID=CAMNT_0043068343 /DNA_START=16 /DNA_END=1569 /DNA_ORIENTATION=+